MVIISYMQSSNDRCKEPTPDSTLTVSLPDWCDPWMKSRLSKGPLPTEHAGWMDLTLELCQEHILQKTGGPFAALIVERSLGLVSIGLNRVVPCNCSSAHAEVMAISLAQKQLKTHDLSSSSLQCTLYCSAEPCAMCIGAIHWSGISHIVFGASDSDVRSTGFDEGHKPENWVCATERSGINVTEGVGRLRAIELLKAYKASGAPLYNSQKTRNR